MNYNTDEMFVKQSIQNTGLSTGDDSGGHFAIITTEHVDRDMDVVSSMGLSVSNFRKAGMPILLAHKHHDMPIGRFKTLDRIVLDDGVRGWGGEFVFAPTEVGKDMNVLHDGGFIRGWSIGFDPERDSMEENEHGGIDFKSSDLLEVSAVAVPANPNALTSSSGFSVTKAANMLKTGAVRKMFIEACGENAIEKEVEEVKEVEGGEDMPEENATDIESEKNLDTGNASILIEKLQGLIDQFEISFNEFKDFVSGGEDDEDLPADSESEKDVDDVENIRKALSDGLDRFRGEVDEENKDKDA